MTRILKFLVLIPLVFAGCKKELPDGGVIKGKNRIVVTVQHHERILQGINVYLEYNAVEFPGHDTAQYDWSTASDLSGVAVFNDLFDGSYFLYGKGIDSGIGLEVKGAHAVVLSDSTTVNNEVYVTLYVTE